MATCPAFKKEAAHENRQGEPVTSFAAAASAELAEMAAVTFDGATNSGNILLYDENHAAKLTEIDDLTFRQNGKLETLEV